MPDLIVAEVSLVAQQDRPQGLQVLQILNS